MILAVTAVAAPFLLITFGEHVVPSGLTAVLISPASLFIALLAPFILPSEKIDRRQGAGHAARSGRRGAGGGRRVGALAPRSSWARWRWSARRSSTGCRQFVVKGRYGTLAAVQTSWISVTIAGLITLPIAIATTPGHTPTLGASAAVLGLGVVGTALAFVVFYELINGIGPARAALVSYLAPGVALFYGAIFLDEAITVAAVIGLVLILGGVAIASRAKRVKAPVPAPAPMRA